MQCAHCIIKHRMYGVDSQPFHSDERRRSAVYEQGSVRAAHEKTCLEPTAASKGIARTDELNLDHLRLLVVTSELCPTLLRAL